MLYVFGRIYEYGLYIMHDLSMTWDLWERKNDERELLLNALAFLKVLFMENVFYIILNYEGLLWDLVTLCLPIPLVPAMYP